MYNIVIIQKIHIITRGKLLEKIKGAVGLPQLSPPRDDFRLGVVAKVLAVVVVVVIVAHLLRLLLLRRRRRRFFFDLRGFSRRFVRRVRFVVLLVLAVRGQLGERDLGRGHDGRFAGSRRSAKNDKQCSH